MLNYFLKGAKLHWLNLFDLKENNMWNPDLYQKTIKFAAEAHGDQKIPGSNIPYVVHLATVCMEATNALIHTREGDINLVMQCALLHDTIEDTPISYDEVFALFGERVAKGVHALTKNEYLPKSEQMLDSLKRILAQGAEIRIVKMADRIFNLQAPPHYWSQEKRLAYQEEARLIFEQLNGVNPFIEERLAQKIEAYSLFIN